MGIHLFSFRLSCNEFPASQVQRDHVSCVKESDHLALLFAFYSMFFDFCAPTLLLQMKSKHPSFCFSMMV